MANDLEKYLIQKARIKGLPVRATLELTPACNMNCTMCYIRHTADEIASLGGIQPVSYWINLIPELKALGTLFVSLIGGEPFILPDLSRIYQAYYAEGFYMSITTNGTLLADGIPKWLIRQKPRYMVLSLYGASDETYAKVTGHPHGFSQAIAGLQNLLHADIPVKLNFMVTEENAHDLEAVVAISQSFGLPLLATAYCFPPIRKKNAHTIHRLSAKACAYETLHIMKLQHPDRYRDRIAYLAGQNFKQHTEQHVTHLTCQAGRTTFWITWQGYMVPCGMIRSLALSLTPGNLSECWQKLREATAALMTSSQCAICHKREVCTVCPAMMEAETGTLTGTPAYLCEMTDEMIDLSLNQSHHFENEISAHTEE